MKINLPNKKLLILIIFCFIIFIPKIVQASSFSITQSKSTLEPGSSATITISTDCIGRFNISCSNGSVSESKLWLESSSGTVTVNAAQSGTTTVTVTPANPVSNSQGEKINLEAKTVSFKINGEETTPSAPTQTPQTPSNSGNTQAVSNNANLSNLGVVGYDFTGFTPNKTSYNTSVPNNITSVSVYANLQNSGATYTVSGNNNLDVGTNKITVTVTATDKTTKKYYYIYIARAAQNQENVVPNVIEENTEEPTEEEKDKLGLISIAIEDGYDIYLEPEFKSDVYDYIINLKEDLEKIPLNAIANRENVKVEITGNENLQEGENIIKITVTDEENNETAQYNITIKKVLNAKETEEVEKTESNIKKETSYNTEKNIWIFILIGLIIFIILIVIFIIIKSKRKNKEDFEDEEIVNEEIIDEVFEKEERRKGKYKGKHF